MFAASKTASVSGGYQISRSLRFNSADSAYLSRTPASATNRRTWTWSGWIKRSSLVKTNEYVLFACRPSAYTIFSIRHSGSATPDTILLEDNNGTNLRTTQVFRDVSAWYHIVLAVDTTQATSTDRVKIYVNGSQVTAFSATTYPTQNVDLQINTTNSHGVGGYSFALSECYDGYMTEVNFIDGTQLTPSSFGETNAQTGVWSPIVCRSAYGTNGFYLNFSDNSNTTAATLGKDYSGNGNNWTPNNFSVTAGAGNDSLVDSPTLYGTDTGAGGSVRGNYATLNPLSKGATSTLSNGNLDFSNVTGSSGLALSTIGMSSGKWYCEVTALGSDCMVGVFSQSMASGAYLGENSFGYGYYQTGSKYNNNSSSAYGSSYTTNDIIGIALDMDAGTLVFYKNNVSQGTAFSSLSGTFYFAAGNGSVNCLGAFNFGQRPFAYTAPSGYKSLCTQNLPTPTVGATNETQAGKFFNPVLYTGNGTGQSITGVGFQPDLVWIKGRSGATSNALYDAVRGVQKQLQSNTATAETTETTGLTAFGSDGFTTGLLLQLNTIAATYVAWNWKANGSGSTNTTGSLSATVSASATSGFSVVTFTSQSSGTATVGHGLGVAPSMYIAKIRTTDSWYVYHTSLGAGNFVQLNGTGASAAGANLWNSTAPTSSVFSMGSSWAGSLSMLVYCFAEVAGYSKIGSYTGNGSADGPFVFTGMRPAYVMIKRTDTTGNWIVWDAVRNTYNVMGEELYPNLSNASSTNTDLDFLSNGFKLRSTTADFNASSGTYIYMAFASNPFKYSLAR